MSEEAISAMEAFATQDSNFKTSTDKSFSMKAQRKKCPTQLIYASSASDVDTTFYRHYKNFAKQMFLGNRDFFCCDIPCDVPLHPTLDGELHAPLLSQSKIDSAMSANKEKALREYYNKFTTDGGENQIVKWGMIRRNETFVLPELHFVDGGKYALAFDPARVNDGSIITAMKIILDPEIGYYGEIVNCTNLVDLASKKGIKLSSPEQIKILKENILAYNGNSPDYENILSLSIDPGAGGAGIPAFGDHLLESWADAKGKYHKGFLDKECEIYQGYERKYPDASDKLHFVSPQKYRTQMVDEFIELMQLDLIKFPKEYNGKGYITQEKQRGDEIELFNRTLTMEEEVALMNIDTLKTEITSVYKFENPEKTSKSYRYSKEKEGKVPDDRFYTIILLSHYLYNLRRNNITKKKGEKRSILDYFITSNQQSSNRNQYSDNH